MTEVSVTTAAPRRRFDLWSVDWGLVFGIAMVIALVLFGIFGPMLIEAKGLKVGSSPYSKAPSLAHWLGTNASGQDLFALNAYGTIPTLRIGLVAGGLGTLLGVVLGVVAGYYGGKIDAVIRTVADIMLTIPSLLVLVVIASYVNNTSLEVMSLIIAIFAWPLAARTSRSQTLSLRERAFIDMARLSGKGDLRIIAVEIMPNLLPFIVASLVAGVTSGTLASIGLQFLGLGPRTVPTLGLVLQNAFPASAVFRGMWWWWLPPTLLLTFLFLGLFLISIALDALANPRLRGEGK